MIDWPEKLPATTTRVLDAASEIMGEPEPDALAFLHAVLAQCALPYRDPKQRDYFRQNGRAGLVISAGHMLDPQTRKPVLQGVPYGAKPRLLMLHLCTMAIRTQSPVIPVADSMTAFMRDLGLHATGGKNGSISRFKEQLNRLAAARMQMTFDAGEFATIINPGPVIERMDVWFPTDPRQRVLWPSEVRLSDQFFGSLQGHALPIDPRAIRAIQHSARALDIYTWLVHRLPRVKGRNGDRVSWASLQLQFGTDDQDRKTFKRQFREAMRQATAVYPRARIDDVDGGIVLHRSDPAIRKRLRE